VAQLLAWDCVDQVVAFVAPKLVGGRLSPTPVGGDGHGFMAEAWRLQEMTWRESGVDLELSAFLY
jgi:diaminohydroxyphosphoribosylaminopyrimidine deaminase / 5-amino-6-(5-phosphoribosylamino)uracil reductase